MKTILCYGDSNTFGADPASREHRFEYDVRWTGRLQSELGDGYQVIEEGLGGRTTVFDDPFEPMRSGKNFLPVCLESHRPLDMVVIMLGTNDMKLRFNAPVGDSALGAEALVQIIRKADCGVSGGEPEILIVAPPLIDEKIKDSPFGEMMGPQAPERSRRFASCFRAAAEEARCRFFDAATVASVGQDGLHLTAASHSALAKAIAGQVREILG